MSIKRCIVISLNTLLFLTCFHFAGAQDTGSTGNDQDTAKNSDPVIVPRPKWEPPEDTTASVPETFQDIIIIQGMVITEDGSPPPFGTTIERDCGTFVQKEILVDANGFFNFIIGDEHRFGGLLVDAEENFFDETSRTVEEVPGYRDTTVTPKGPSFETDVLGCVVRAKYEGYRSTSANLGLVNRLGLIDAGTILMYPESRIKGNAISITNLNAPKESKKALKKGKEAFDQERFVDAAEYYRAALQSYPKYSEAWVELGWLYQRLKQNNAAREAYQKALDADKSYVSPYIRLAQLSSLEKKWKQSVEFSEKALSLDPVSYPQTYFLNGLAYYNLNKLDDAERNIRKGIKLDLTHQVPKMYLVLANILTKKEDFTGSLDSMRTYVRIAPDAPDADHIRSLIKDNEKNIRALREINLQEPE